MAELQYFNHLMEILETTKETRKTSRGIFQNVTCAAGGVALGGFVAGPPGALVGGIVGTVIGFLTSPQYLSIFDALKRLTNEEKRRLVAKVKEVVGNQTLEAFMGSKANQKVLVDCVSTFVKK